MVDIDSLCLIKKSAASGPAYVKLHEITIDEWWQLAVARAAQALAPRVAMSF
ncbi:MAG: hypothetical protein PVH42_23715 [Desulfobacterales bacterium]|jgi:hypothetical protein